MKPWKKFEKEFMLSIPEDRRAYRLMDWWMYGWAQSRFTPSNLCDLLMKEESRLWCVELKTTKSKSITIPRQLSKMINNKWPMVHSVFVINFREYSKTYLLDVSAVEKVSKIKKSINMNDCEELGELIPEAIVKPNRTKVTYYISLWFYRFRTNHMKCSHMLETDSEVED